MLEAPINTMLQKPPAPTESAKSRLKSRQRLAMRHLLVGLACTAIAAFCLFAFKQPRHAAFFYAQRSAPRHATKLRSRTPIAARIVAGAKAQQGTLYNPEYTVISYPNGDVPREHGACTDVVIRALRAAGYDLQQLIHEDMRRNFPIYPHQWGLTHPDPNIDHRRVPNQMRFFARHGRSLTTVVASATLAQWQPGDFVYWDIGGGHLHTGVLSDTCNSAGVPFVVHNCYICVEQDCLAQWKIIGHFRYPTAPSAAPAAKSKGRRVPVDKNGLRQATVI